MGHGQGSLAACHEIDEIPRRRHGHAVAGDNRVSFWPLFAVERLDQEKSHPFEANDLLGGNDRADDAAKLHSGPPPRHAGAKLGVCFEVLGHLRMKLRDHHATDQQIASRQAGFGQGNRRLDISDLATKQTVAFAP